MEEITLESLGLKFAIVNISHAVEGEERQWPHVAFDCVFSRDVGGSICRNYKMGIGHFPTKGINDPWGVQRKGPRAKAEFACMIARQKKITPNPIEVLWSLCRDGLSAFQSTFPDWCGEFGYDSDSIKALEIYNECLRIHTDLSRILSREQIEQIAALEF
jgi:hypothetical protein